MIPAIRVGINKRFIEVFNILVEKGDIVMNDRGGKGIGDFANDILGKPYSHIIRAFLSETDKRCIDYHHVDKLCDLYGVSKTYLLEGKGNPLEDKRTRPSGNVSPLPSFPPMEGNNNICFTNIEAFAGNSVEWDSFRQENQDYFHIPGLDGGELFAFPIKGNSMLPVINDGDIVVCKPLHHLNEFKENKIYAINDSGSIWVKYVQKEINTKYGITRLKLISANHLEHDPFHIDVSENTKLFQVVRRISALD
jgi:phage repressor protein C with HTH and peptisase S24 domain